MKRNLLSAIAASAFSAGLFISLLVPTKAAAQSPTQGPPAVSSNPKLVVVDNLTTILTKIIQPAITAENKRLVNDPNFHAVITLVPNAYQVYMSSTTDLDQPNQNFADVPYSMIYQLTNVSVRVNGSFVPYPDGAYIAQPIDLKATCSGWFTGRGALTYNAVAGNAVFIGDTNFPNPQVGMFLQQIIPNYVNTVVTPRLASFPAGSPLAEAGAACRSLGTQPQVVIFAANQAQSVSQPPDGVPPAIAFDPPVVVPPIVAALNSVTVKVTRIRRLPVHGINGQISYEPVETPTLDFYAGFTHLHIPLPAMTEGQSFSPTSDNVATTQVPLECGMLVLLGVMTYENLAHQDSAFVTYAKNLNFGAGSQTLDTPKVVIRPSGLNVVVAHEPAYEITVEITPPLSQIGSI